jgi:hypothetical protein
VVAAHRLVWWKTLKRGLKSLQFPHVPEVIGHQHIAFPLSLTPNHLSGILDLSRQNHEPEKKSDLNMSVKEIQAALRKSFGAVKTGNAACRYP